MFGRSRSGADRPPYDPHVRIRLPLLTEEGRRAARHALLISLWLGAVWWSYEIISLGPRARGEWLGIDAFAYWYAFEHDLYEADGIAQQTGSVESFARYLYSPLFAQLIWPLTQLPWPVFSILWSGSIAAVFLWLLRPLPWIWRIPMFMLLCLEEVLLGNVRAFIALALVVALKHPAAWAVPALTKAVSAVGVLWHPFRGEWRRFGVAIAALVGAVLVSFLAAPDLWFAWIDYLRAVEPTEVGVQATVGRPSPVTYYFVRLPIAVLLVLMAALAGRPVWLAPATAVASPVMYLFADISFLAAVPRLAQNEYAQSRYVDRFRRQRGTQEPGQTDRS